MRLAMLLVLAGCWRDPPPPAPPANRAPPAPPAPPKPTGEARSVQRSATGGVLELVGDREAAMTRANDAMAKHCGPQSFTIVQEGEEAVASDDATGAITTAWRVHYECNSGPD